MAAYAAVVSLMNTVEQIQNHPRHSLSLDKKQIETLGEKVSFLEEFLKNYSHGGGSETEALESQIASAAFSAEDVIESHVFDQIHADPVSLLDLQKVIEEMGSVEEKVMKVKEEKRVKDLPTYSWPATSLTPLPTEKSKMVGFDDELIQLMDWLTGQHSNRQIIPIVGMGGIGKTTLAKNAYENPLIVQYFDFRAWATISQVYSVKEILLQLLSYQGQSISKTEDELGEMLHKSLSGRRYLVILDDMWSIEAWDKIKLYFPDNCNRSRIVVTTRQANVAIHFGSLCLAMNFLDEDKGWKLFCQNVFAQDGCPLELVETGKMIVKKCKGLPLSIVVIGGLLRKSSKTQECWENVAKDINSILMSGEDDQCFNILSFSYSHLPAHLKPCFFYMGTFPEDYNIPVSELTKLWIAEGFLRNSTEAQSLEEAAQDYLKDLVDRNLILVRRLGSNGKIKTCYIHDILRDLCLRIAVKEKFLCEMRMLHILPNVDRKRRIVFGDNPQSLANLVMCEGLLSRSLILGTLHSDCVAYDGDRLLCKFRLLRVLNVVSYGTVAAVFHQFNLRYLACGYLQMNKRELPSSISLLWNVQTLICRGKCYPDPIVAPCEIWEMPQLRHLVIEDIRLPDPHPSDQQDGFILQNLQTLKTIRNFRLSEEVCKRIPNVKTLHICYDDFSASSSDYCLYNLGHLHKLELLNCIFYGRSYNLISQMFGFYNIQPNRDDLLQNLRFPSSLVKLSLAGWELHWEDLTIISSLSHLEVLKLKSYAVIGPEWNPVEGEFLSLKYLEISHCTDLICWNGDSSHFPVLENLVLRGLSQLDEIPSGVGEILTLKVIHLDYCSESAAISALKILEVQESLGNEDLQVRVLFWEKSELKSFREKLEHELDSFTSNNYHLEAYKP